MRSCSSTSATRTPRLRGLSLSSKASSACRYRPAASKRITFDVPAAQLGFHGRDLDYVVEPGVVEVFVGTSSTDLVDAGTVTLVADPAAGPPDKAFDGWVTVE